MKETQVMTNSETNETRLIESASDLLFELEDIIKKFKLRKSLNKELNEEACLIFKHDLKRTKRIIKYIKKG